jgi:N-acetylglucosaminyldiphosphoundecaprenol N-acetyl-beta-D-mannosaminyltransferase
MSSQSVAILGVPVHNVSMDEAVDRVDRYIRAGGFHQIATANADFLINATVDPELREVLGSCDLIVADGMPLVWAARLMGVRFKERVAGADLVPRLAALSNERSYRMFFLGSTAEASSRAAETIERMYPNVRIAGRLTPEPQPLELMDDEAMCSQIEAAGPDILLVAFGSPKQEKWIYRNRQRLSVPVCIGVGASLDFLGGVVHRAPGWMQRSGLEWLYRLYQEPRRLFSRYFHDAYGLARHLPRQVTSVHRQRRGTGQGRAFIEALGSVSVLHVEGALTGQVLEQVNTAAQLVASGGHALILDLSAATYLGAEAMGELLEMRRLAKRAGIPLRFAGLPRMLAEPVRAARLGKLHEWTPSVAEAIRSASPSKLQLSIEAGEDWATLRVGGELTASDSFLIESLSRCLSGAKRRFEIDMSGASTLEKAVAAEAQ